LRLVGTLAFKLLGGGAVVADVGHAGADEHFVDWLASNGAKQLSDEILILSVSWRFPEIR